MISWLTLTATIVASIGLIIKLFQVWKRPRLEIIPNHEKSYFYAKCQFDKEQIGEPIGTVLEFCLIIENRGRGEAKVKHFDIEIPDIGKNYPDIKHIERNAKGRIESFRTCPTARYTAGKNQNIAVNKRILVNNSDTIKIPADDRTPEGYIYFHIKDNIPENKEQIECDLELYDRGKAEAKFKLKRKD